MENELLVLFPCYPNEIKLALKHRKKLEDCIEFILKLTDPEVLKDENFATQLSETFSKTDKVPACSQNAAVYQLFVYDQVSSRKE